MNSPIIQTICPMCRRRYHKQLSGTKCPYCNEAMLHCFPWQPADNLPRVKWNSPDYPRVFTSATPQQPVIQLARKPVVYR